MTSYTGWKRCSCCLTRTPSEFVFLTLGYRQFVSFKVMCSYCPIWTPGTVVLLTIMNKRFMFFLLIISCCLILAPGTYSCISFLCALFSHASSIEMVHLLHNHRSHRYTWRHRGQMIHVILNFPSWTLCICLRKLYLEFPMKSQVEQDHLICSGKRILSQVEYWGFILPYTSGIKLVGTFSIIWKL